MSWLNMCMSFFNRINDVTLGLLYNEALSKEKNKTSPPCKCYYPLSLPGNLLQILHSLQEASKSGSYRCWDKQFNLVGVLTTVTLYSCGLCYFIFFKSRHSCSNCLSCINWNSANLVVSYIQLI